MRDCLTFDTEPNAAFLFGERGANKVVELLEKMVSKEVDGYINIINLTEVYYAIARKDPKVAEDNLRFLRQYGSKVVPVEEYGYGVKLH